jgi:hypothetical protein
MTDSEEPHDCMFTRVAMVPTCMICGKEMVKHKIDRTGSPPGRPAKPYPREKLLDPRGPGPTVAGRPKGRPGGST